MKHTYQVLDMSCGGCEDHFALNKFSPPRKTLDNRTRHSHF
jgi:hypothetical protein